MYYIILTGVIITLVTLLGYLIYVKTYLPITNVRKVEEELSDRVDELATTNRTMETLMYSMAHDLKSPVRSAGGMISELRCELSTAEVDKTMMNYMLDMLQRSISRSMSTIDGVLDYAKAGQSLNILDNIFINKNIDSLIEELGAEHMVTLDYLGSIKCDSNAFIHVIHNLIENGLKYNDKSKKFISIYRRENVIYVEDNGNGINNRYLSKVVQPFQRLSSSTSGTGLGLGIVTKLLELHNYTLEIESEEGQGSIFKICM